MKVWVTRARPGAQATARRLRALGHTPAIAPLLEVRPVEVRPDLAGIGALAFTSANGVRAFARQSSQRALPVYAVGSATAAAARRAGFARVISADGDVAALTALIAADPGRPEGAILHPGAREPAGDLAGALAAAGVPARSAIVYETVANPARPPPGAQAVLLHSPRAARILAEGLSVAGAPAPAALCLSPAVAAPLSKAPLARILVAAAPSEDALLALLEKLTTPP